LGEALGLTNALRALARRVLPPAARRALRIAAAELPRRVRDFVPDLVNREQLPPPALRFHVAGSSDRRSFLTIGANAARQIVGAASRHRDPASLRDLLDFGCGCGRIARHIPRLLPQARVSGIDIDASAVAWCAGHLEGDWQVSAPDPPSDLAPGSFDVIYAVSVFTHLPEERQRRWIAELHRLLREDGLLIVTTLGPELVWTRPDLDTAQRERLLSRGFVYAPGAASFNEDSSFQSREYIEHHWDGFKLLEHTTHGLAQYQDLAVFGKDI
jgi:SAM-dependent methyltransferase